jgi:hypothetical protein
LRRAVSVLMAKKNLARNLSFRLQRAQSFPVVVV